MESCKSWFLLVKKSLQTHCKLFICVSLHLLFTYFHWFTNGCTKGSREQDWDSQVKNYKIPSQRLKCVALARNIVLRFSKIIMPQTCDSYLWFHHVFILACFHTCDENIASMHVASMNVTSMVGWVSQVCEICNS